VQHQPQSQVDSTQVLFIRERKEGRETKYLFWKLMVAERVTELVLFLWVTLISLIKNCISDLWFLVLITMSRRWCWNGKRRRRICMHTFVDLLRLFLSQFCFWVWSFIFTFFFSSFWICCSSQKKFYRVGTIVEEVLLNANLVQQPTNKKGWSFWVQSWKNESTGF